jgi:Fuc2NAc and GlcNAc transferase
MRAILQITMVLLMSFCLSSIFAKYLKGLLSNKKILDIPNSRSSHQNAVPRGGGVGIILGFLISVEIAHFVLNVHINQYLILATMIVAITGFADDYFGDIPVLLRLLLHFTAACIIVNTSGSFQELPLPIPFNVALGILSAPFTLLWIIGLTNIYNFLDGIDGYAGTQGLVVGLALASMGDQKSIVMLGVSIAAACGGFLLLNWHPARIFMGDVGSCSLGFLYASLPLEFHIVSKSEAVFFTAIFLWFFLADGIFTMVRRLISGEKIWTAHRSHLYQRLVIRGISHSRVTMSVMLGSVFLSTAAIYVYKSHNNILQWVLLFVSIVGFYIYKMIVNLVESKELMR